MRANAQRVKARTADAIVDVQRRALPCLVILDEDYAVASAGATLGSLLKATGIELARPDRLPQPLESEIRKRLANSARCDADDISFVYEKLFVRCNTLTGPQGFGIAVLLEPIRSRDPVGTAAKRYGLSTREVDVLHCVIAGMRVPEIAERLCIAQSTVIEHIKRMYVKMGVNNRAAMAARIFGLRESELLK